MDFYLTTDHPASQYGVPVLVIDGKAYSAMDTLPNGEIAFYFMQHQDAEGKAQFLKSAPDLYYDLQRR